MYIQRKLKKIFQASIRQFSAVLINQFKKIAGSDASQQRILVCRIDKTRNLPGKNIALPWSVFPEWLKEIID